MTRPQSLRFGRSAPTMAYPSGRLLALRDGRLYVFAVDGWTPAAGTGPSGATWLTRDEVHRWCAKAGVDTAALDQVPTD